MQYIDEIIKIPIKENGEIFHYTSAEALNGMLSNDEIWATDSNFLNDKGELKYTYNLFNECFIDKMVHVNSRDKLRRELERLIASSLDYDDKPWEWYIISFSLTNDNLALWSEFSNPVGYALGVDVSTFTKALENSFSLVVQGKVQYNRKKQIELLKYGLDKTMTLRDEYEGHDGLDDFDDNTPAETIRNLALDLMMVCSVYSFFFKKYEFHVEDEYRFVCDAIPSKNNGFIKPTIYSRIRQGAFIPYIKIKITIKDVLRSIMVCPRNDSDIMVDGVKALCNHRRINVPIHESSINLRY